MRIKATKDSLSDGIRSIRIVIKGRSHEINFPAVCSLRNTTLIARRSPTWYVSWQSSAAQNMTSIACTLYR